MSVPKPEAGERLNASGQAGPTRAVMQYRLGSNIEMEGKVRGGKVVIGRLRIFCRFTAGLAFVGSPMFPSDVVLRSVENRKQALHGDIVAVQLLSEENWPALDDVEDDGQLDDVSHDSLGAKEVMPENLPDGRSITRWVQDATRPDESFPECQWAKRMSAPALHDWGGRKPFGVVVAVLERSCPLHVVARLCDDALQPNEAVKSNRYYQFKCFDPLLPNIAVFGRDIPVLLHARLQKTFFLLRLVTRGDGDFFWTAWKFLTGKIVRVLGEVDSIQANSFALCNACEISMDDFSEEAYACVPETFSVPDKQTLLRLGRRDLREEEFVCSIDPATARDLDDALSIDRTPGGYRVGVHIADVSYFVPASSPLDEEACERSTSVYLVEKVIPMLPRKLSEDFCSLNPSGDKFAFSCLFHLDHHGKVTSEWFGQSVIRNRCRLTYEDAQRILDGDATVFDTLDFGDATDVQRLRERVELSIRTLFELASKLRMSSLRRGRLTIGNMKIRYQFEDIANPTFPQGFDISRQIEANWLVEEFMLLANARVAEKIVEYMPDQALLRQHEPPDRERVATLKATLGRLGLEMQGGSSKSLQEMLDNAKNSEFYDDFCVALKYVLQQAKYFVNGCEETEAYRGHYALAMPWYTHFTSPIRRYSDIIVHRQLLCALEIESIVKGIRVGQNGRCRPVQPGSVNPNQLSTRDYFYPVSEVENIVVKANVKKLMARQVSDASLGIFFCYYLKALKRVMDASGNAEGAPFAPRVQAVVVRVVAKNSTFTLFAKEVAQEGQISLKDKEQRFKSDKPVDDAADNSEEKKDKKKKRVEAEAAQTAGSLSINWGPHPVTGDEVVEEVLPMTAMTAVLTIRKQKGYEELKMIVDPPWERKWDAASIPKTLLSC
ncbi:putative mitochondrial exoribonuclease DSS-1 [Trypanosoma rangeli]|uniref:Putative mitochondrial exoribonuclease DSS-1 n=1 Tax=Trypanosoma rangeli TaxID=5698 RepID=A0A422P1Q3_TRYRA|nr:putative mitochondrial exoribonuclease DSS-1 [Trypanosoma rangeli]RNF11605.1 putative mitochondrial exoribonuclease DSS-1 [Trypanosoma rangeli]|eukprot:RNF11605.1 putative mitochondrial exoribonuclease DSS-1 [Trypanosoma rangeli]